MEPGPQWATLRWQILVECDQCMASLGPQQYVWNTGLILDLHPANGRLRYKETPSLIGWAKNPRTSYKCTVTVSIKRSGVWYYTLVPRWRHQMETFPAFVALCAGNSPVTGEFPSQRPVTRSFDVFFDLSLNKRLYKQSRGWWFETSSRSLWRHCHDLPTTVVGWVVGGEVGGTANNKHKEW